MSDQDKTERIHVQMTPAEKAELDKWRLQKSVDEGKPISRAEAIRRLVKAGLEALR